MSPARGRSELRMDQPLDRGRIRGPSYDPEQWGRLSERIARFIGSWKFIAWMTVVIVSWLLWNIFAPDNLKPDPYPFIFLTLMLSLQASYAAPLILLAQNRQADRDKVQYLEDREMTDRLVADTEYLAREIAALRAALGEVATRDYLRNELRDLADEIADRIRTADADMPGSTQQPTQHSPDGSPGPSIDG